MPRLRTSTAGRRAPKRVRSESRSPQRRRPARLRVRAASAACPVDDAKDAADVDISDVSDVADVQICDVDESDVEHRSERALAAAVSGTSVVDDVPIDDIVDAPVDDIGSVSDATDELADQRARRATQPRIATLPRRGDKWEEGVAVANVPVEDVGVEGRPRRRCVRRAPTSLPEKDRRATGLLPPSGATGGKLLEKSVGTILVELQSACEPGLGCWRTGEPCRLRCKATVRKHAATLAIEVAKTYNCTAVQRDQTVFEMTRPSTENGRKVYRLAGIRVCRRAVARILGLGSGHIQRIRHARFDRRRLPRDLRREKQRGEGYRAIYSFLWHVYESVAECRPDHPQAVGLGGGPGASEARNSVDAFLARGGDSDRATQAGDALPRKYLPPGCPKDYWWMFLTEGHAGGSYTTFKRVWKEWADHLSFDSFASHSRCDRCSELRAAMLSAANAAIKVQRASELKEHLGEQWLDRLVYWRMRQTGREPDGEWLVLIADGADQAKFRIMKAARWPKAFDRVHRPRVQMIGCWVHGHECSFSMREEDVQKGSNYVIEVIVRALGRVLAERRRQGRRRPINLWIQTDNASGENKNQFLERFCAVLVDRGIFHMVVHAFLEVGHTHEDIDAIFSTLSGYLGSQLAWDTPHEMAEHAQRYMAPRMPREKVTAGVLGDARAWLSWLAPLDDVKEKKGLTQFTGPGSARFLFVIAVAAPCPYSSRGIARPRPTRIPTTSSSS